MKKLFMIFLLFAFVNISQAQLIKFEKENMFSESEVYKDASGNLYSYRVKFGYSKQMAENTKGKKEVDEDKIKFQSLKKMIKELEDVYGKLKLYKENENITWGDTLRVHKRSKKMVKVVDLSQQYYLEFESLVPVEEVVEKLTSLENIKYAEGPMIAYLTNTVPNDTWYSLSSSSGPYKWSFDVIKAEKAWDVTVGSSLINVGIHDQFEQSIALHNEISSKVVWESSSLGGKHGDHGTMTAGIVGAASNNGTDIASMGWNVRLMLGKFTYYTDLVNLVDQGADIINCSWVTSYNSSSLSNNILYALQQGVVVIASAGNTEYTQPSLRYPAAYNFGSTGQVIAVSATQMDGTEQFIDGFNYSPGTNPITDPTNAFIDVSAPGANYRSLSRTSTSGTEHVWSGTSVSAPFVSGLVSLMLSVNSSLTPPQVYDILRRTTDRIGQYSYDSNGWNRYLGYGRIDAENAVYVASGHPAKPRGVTLSWTSNHPKISWEAGEESNLSSYKVYKKSGSTFSLVATTTNTYWIDYSEYQYSSGTKEYVYYAVKAVDSQNDYSTMSDDVQAAVNGGTVLDKENININVEKPTKYDLVQNYPNPFNPTTIISYQIPDNEFVTLKVYNSLGEEVKTLVNAQQSVGYYNVEFDGSGLSSGLYFYKLQAGEFVSVKKMLLTK